MTVTNFPNGISVAGNVMVGGATFVVGAEASNVINVAIQLTDGDGNALAVSAAVWAYLSDQPDGSDLTAAAPDGGVAIGTDGLAITLATNTAWLLVSEADGDIDLDITDVTGTPTWYLVVVLPTGALAISDAITFA